MSSLQTPNWMESLNQRELEILGLITNGLSNREISQELYLSPDTVKWYNKQIFKKLVVSNRTQAVKIAREYRLLEDHAGLHSGEQPILLTNLPAQLTSYVGRVKEIAEIKALLKSHRLVVLTGAGGTGKTRLALQVADGLIGDFRDGVWLVELAPLSEPDLVPLMIAQVLKVNIGAGASPTNVLKRFLKRKHLLLLLDNFEHLLDATPLVGELLAAAPQVVVLTTSRERLHVYGEQEYPVNPLALPDLHRVETAEQLLAYEAVDLFIQRAQASHPPLVIDDVQISAAARICVRLDGLPLAIELAASQVKIFQPSVLAQRMVGGLDALPSGPRDLPARQRTLRKAIEWSHDLLNEDEKRLFSRLGVFSGGGTLESIEHICGIDLPGKIVDLLSSLVDKSLVFTRESPGGEPRFTMLETIREYAKERLTSGGEFESIQRFHTAYFADLAEQSQKEIYGARQRYWVGRLQAEQDNMHSALVWSFNGQENTYGLRTVSALGHYWYYHGTAQERYWIELALERMDDASPDLKAGVLWAAGFVYYYLGDLHSAQDLLRLALDLYRQLGDERYAAWVMTLLSVVEMEDREDIESCIIMAQESLATLRRLEDRTGMTRALTALGELARIKGDFENARCYYEEGLALSKEDGGLFQEAVQYNNLSFVAFRQKDYQLSMNLMRQALIILRELDLSDMSTWLCGLAGSMAALGYSERAARLIGAADAQQEISGVPFQSPDLQDVLPILETIRQDLGEEVFQEAWLAGREMTTQEAYDFALSDLSASE